MSRGLGKLERWLLDKLPPPTERSATTDRLASRYYDEKVPNEAQLSSVRRALRSLERHGLAQRVDFKVTFPGNPNGWKRR